MRKCRRWRAPVVKVPERRRILQLKRHRHDDRRAEQVQDDLLELCRNGVLELGIQDGEPTYRVTEDFGKLLDTCHAMIMAVGGYEGEAPIEMVATLALAHKFKRILMRDICRLARALESVLRFSITPSYPRYRRT